MGLLPCTGPHLSPTGGVHEPGEHPCTQHPSGQSTCPLLVPRENPAQEHLLNSVFTPCSSSLTLKIQAIPSGDVLAFSASCRSRSSHLRFHHKTCFCTPCSLI